MNRRSRPSDDAPRHCRQATDDDRVLVGLDASQSGGTEFRIDLDLRGQTVVETRVEQVGVHCDKAVDPPIVHEAHSLPGIGHVRKGCRVGCSNDVRVNKDRA